MITIPVSVGELIDKYSILQIKKAKVTEDRRTKVEEEMRALINHVRPFLEIDSISVLYDDLLGVNLQLWDVEDKLRIMEKDKMFDDKFVSLARSVYYLNDERFNLKNKINTLTNSDIKEVKQYIDYK